MVTAFTFPSLSSERFAHYDKVGIQAQSLLLKHGLRDSLVVGPLQTENQPRQSWAPVTFLIAKTWPKGTLFDKAMHTTKGILTMIQSSSRRFPHC
eukprot:1133151-Pelagomonas_calceolata.AAC.4